MRYFTIISLFLSLILTSCTAKYYIVRHAEKLNNTDTSSLTSAGEIRAQALKTLLENEGIDYIFASNFRRTQLTAKPLADALGKSVIIYSPDTTQALIDQLKRYGSSKILIVGHTSNIPQLVEGLSDDSISPIPENDFDNIYIVEVKKQIGWTSRYLTSSTYGAPSP